MMQASMTQMVYTDMLIAELGLSFFFFFGFFCFVFWGWILAYFLAIAIHLC